MSEHKQGDTTFQHRQILRKCASVKDPSLIGILGREPRRRTGLIADPIHMPAARVCKNRIGNSMSARRRVLGSTLICQLVKVPSSRP